MKWIITFTSSDFEQAYKYLLQGKGEEAVFFLAGISEAKDATNLLVREVIPVPMEGFLERR